MNYNEKLEKVIEECNGVVTTKECNKRNIPNSIISRAAKKGRIEKYSDGIYVAEEIPMDPHFLFQLRFPRSIFSYESALQLHGVSERFEHALEVTVNTGYKFNDQDYIFPHYVKKEYLDLGVEEIETSHGNKVRVYSLERTFCDMVANRNKVDAETFVKFMKTFQESKINYLQLNEIAEKMGIINKVEDVMGIIRE